MTKKERALFFIICLLTATLATQILGANARIKSLRIEISKCNYES